MRLWNRNLILKARQLGFTTLIALLWLDHALFNGNQRCGIIAQDREAAEAIFRDKSEVRLRQPARRNPGPVPTGARQRDRAAFRAQQQQRARGRVHAFGDHPPAAHQRVREDLREFPIKAAEVITSSIPAVPLNGILVIEHGRGARGRLYDITQRAEDAALRPDAQADGARLPLHFYAWWQEPKYSMDPTTVVVSGDQHE